MRQHAYPTGFKTPKKLAPPEPEKVADEKENPEPAAKKPCPAPKEGDKREGHSRKKRPALATKMFNIESQARRFRLALETVNNVGLQRQLNLELDELMTKVRITGKQGEIPCGCYW